ncbi:hypothetical protein CGRA01v4_14566 [Colletotrichum graminicola]|nr:hypothetical protein CGRA01v4_14566 [Colletotrichum graminicola]
MTSLSRCIETDAMDGGSRARPPAQSQRFEQKPVAHIHPSH